MRDLSQVVARGVVAGSIVMLLAVPAQARPREDWSWLGRTIDPIVKIIKKIGIRTLGDGMTDPWPK
jgi:hypothetical protein